MTKAGAFSAPDALRLLAGCDGVQLEDRKLLQTFWAKVAQKQARVRGFALI